MPTLTIESVGDYEIQAGTRLINAIIDTAKADQHYSCGGQAKCTSCRVQFVEGEPERMTIAEKDLLAANKLDEQTGLRLSCQILVEHDVTIKLMVPKPPNKQPNHPADIIVPPPVWTSK